MNNNNHNKFETVHNYLIEFCDKCKLSKKANCILHDHKCSEFSKKYTEFYYNILYPFHPCKECLAMDDCISTKPCACDAYWHFCRMRLVAECEIKNNAVFFSRERIQMVCGPSDLITHHPRIFSWANMRRTGPNCGMHSMIKDRTRTNMPVTSESIQKDRCM